MSLLRYIPHGFRFQSLLLLAALILASGTYLAGCNEGGTSTEAGNPGLTLQIKGTENGAPFHGFIQFFIDGANPTFFAAPPDDGLSNPQVVLGGEEVSTIVLNRANTFNFNRDLLASLVNAHPAQPLFKSTASREPTTFPEFNIVLIGFDSSCGWLPGIRHDSLTGKFRYSDFTGGDTLVIELKRSQTYTGTLDTSGLPSRPLGLFVPGTPYYAQVQGDSFRFADIPSGKLPLRLISADGWVRAMKDSLGTTWTHPLKPGARFDSLTMPKATPVVAPPVANPSGQFAFTDSVSVALTAESGAIVFYTLDGSVPDVTSKRYTLPIVLHASATLKAVAFLKGHNRSPIAVNNYVLVPVAPIATPPSKVFEDSLVVSLSVKANSGTIHFTVDGSEPGSNSQKYTSPLTLKATTTLKAVTVSTGLGNSRLTEEKYILVTDTTTPTP